MAGYLEVETTTAVRNRLTAITAEFRNRGSAAQPVIFGSHRKPEAVLMPVALVERLLPFLSDEGFDLPGESLPRLSAPTGPRRVANRPGRIRRG